MTCRCQDSTSRLSIKFKVREGVQGALQAFVIPNITPKSCVVVSHKVRAEGLEWAVGQPLWEPACCLQP